MLRRSCIHTNVLCMFRMAFSRVQILESLVILPTNQPGLTPVTADCKKMLYKYVFLGASTMQRALTRDGNCTQTPADFPLAPEKLAGYYEIQKSNSSVVLSLLLSYLYLNV